MIALTDFHNNHLKFDSKQLSQGLNSSKVHQLIILGNGLAVIAVFDKRPAVVRRQIPDVGVHRDHRIVLRDVAEAQRGDGRPARPLGGEAGPAGTDGHRVRARRARPRSRLPRHGHGQRSREGADYPPLGTEVFSHSMRNRADIQPRSQPGCE